MAHKISTHGLRNHEMVQRFCRSTGDKQATYRLVLFQDEQTQLSDMKYWGLKRLQQQMEITDKKRQVGSFGEPTILKKNYAIQMINRLTMKIKPKAKANIDPAPKTRPFMDPDHEFGYNVCDESLPKFEHRYLNNVVNTD